MKLPKSWMRPTITTSVGERRVAQQNRCLEDGGAGQRHHAVRKRIRGRELQTRPDHDQTQRDQVEVVPGVREVAPVVVDTLLCQQRADAHHDQESLWRLDGASIDHHVVFNPYLMLLRIRDQCYPANQE